MSSKAVRRCRSRTVRVDRLPARTIDQMWDMFRRYYEVGDDDRAGWVRSLLEKDVAFIIEDRDTRRMVGFSSALLMTFDGYRIVHSGDTVLERERWGAGKHFAYQMLKVLTRHYLSKPRVPLYWFLISKGYRTYLLMARNLIEFYPTWRGPTPPWAKDVIAEVARRRYGTAFRPQTGVLTFPYRRAPLQPWVTPITDEQRDDADIAYFERANPCWQDGDELACIGVMDLRQLLRSWLKFTTILTRRRWTARRRSGSRR